MHLTVATTFLTMLSSVRITILSSPKGWANWLFSKIPACTEREEFWQVIQMSRTQILLGLWLPLCITTCCIVPNQGHHKTQCLGKISCLSTFPCPAGELCLTPASLIYVTVCSSHQPYHLTCLSCDCTFICHQTWACLPLPPCVLSVPNKLHFCKVSPYHYPINSSCFFFLLNSIKQAFGKL